MNILVNGGAGYIGSHVVKQLGEEGKHNITIVDNLVTGFEDAITYGNFINADLSDYDAVDKIFAENNFDAVIHFAASLVVPESVSDPLKYYMNNTANTANVIRCCIKHNVNKFIFSSTAATYGEPDAEFIPVNEECPTKPINPYGSSKLMSETVLKDTAFAFPDFKYVVFRYFNVAGASNDGKIGQSTEGATHLIKVAAETACGKREKMFIFGDDYDTEDGTCIRDYIHVEDLASAHLKGLEYLNAGNDSNTFNCGYGHGFSVLEVLETMRKVSGVDFTADMKERRAGDPSILISNNSKIREVMNWNPKYDDLDLICKTALEWEKKLS
ncbi:MAG TPA: UDP-glucose 4-epimerase GalE [Campylobacterales bacterium]|nr:UDP-glucose 4-epimerase GalE [Campylobacterales bacterium]